MYILETAKIENIRTIICFIDSCVMRMHIIENAFIQMKSRRKLYFVASIFFEVYVSIHRLDTFEIGIFSTGKIFV